MSATRIIKVRVAGRLVAVKGAPTPTPGLYVNERPGHPGMWCVTHLASGSAVAKVDDPKMALHVAVRLGEVCDWTLPGATIRQSAAITRRCFRILEEEGVLEQSMEGPPVPADVLARMEPLS